MTQDQVRQDIQATDKTTPLLLDAFATWCGPCQLMAKQLEQAATELGSSVRVVKMDTDKNERLAAELRVQGLPTLILFENGKEVKRVEGAMMKDQLMEWIVEE
jgi:thioredoxin